ncbi:hypothetical protein SO802_008074 [Lithocarpus litseifolius]|uniref:Uncharacterized protein n=1 Tax=Lithocarpus litseifolius TaxID=425828 RepID=A0AAW2D9N1_9ROSI
MALFSAFFKCFVPSSLSQVANDAMKAESSEKSKSKSKSKPSGAPIVISYFPVNSILSRLKLLLKFGFLSKKTGASRAEIIVPTGLPNALVVFAHNDLLCGTLMVNYEEGSFGVIGLGVGVSLLS